MKVLKKILWDSINVSDNINEKYLANWQKQVFHKFFNLLNLSAPDSYLLLALNIKASQMLCNNWLTIELNQETFVPINLYWMAIMPTWAWKDSTLDRIDSFLFKKVNTKFIAQSAQYADEKKIRNTNYANNNLKTSSEKEKYIRENAPRFIDQDLWTATSEWIIDMRESMKDAGFGSTSLVISELWTYILNKNNDPWLLEIYLQIYDFWNSPVKLIKGNKQAKAIKWVPWTMMAYSSPEKLFNWNWKESLKSWFNQWFARRLFCLIPRQNEFTSNKKLISSFETIKEYEIYKTEKLNQEKKAYKNAEKISDMFHESYEKTCPVEADEIFWMNIVEKKDYKKIKFSKKSRFVYEAYMDFVKNSYDPTEKSTDEEWVVWEVVNRNRKALKLAWVIATIEHPDRLEINEHDMKCAIYQTEYFWQSVDRFYSAKTNDDVDKLFIFFKKNIWKELIKKDFRAENLTSSRKFASRFNPALLQELQEYAKLEWYLLTYPEASNKIKFYKLTKDNE